MGRPLSPETSANHWTPKPREAPSSVANILLRPFPRVAPENQNEDHKGKFSTSWIEIISQNYYSFSWIFTTKKLTFDSN